MNKPAIISIIFHVVVFVLATTGLPYFAKETEPLEMAITVELVDLAEISQSNLVEKPQESKVQEQPAKLKPVYNNTDSAPDLLSPKAPDIEEIPDIIEPPPKQEKKPDPSIIKKPPKPKSKPKPKKTAPPKEKPAPKDQKDFTSLLKSLTPDEPDSSADQASDKQGQISQIADFSKQMTRGELDDLNRGVQPCWNVNAGGKNAEELLVKLRVFVNPEMRVREVQILDKMRYNLDTHYRAAAEAARRALLNPSCSTLRLPPEKYEQWKVFIYNFDPKGML